MSLRIYFKDGEKPRPAYRCDVCGQRIVPRKAWLLWSPVPGVAQVRALVCCKGRCSAQMKARLRGTVHEMQFQEVLGILDSDSRLLTSNNDFAW